MKKLCLALVVLLAIFGLFNLKSNQKSEVLTPFIGVVSEAFAVDEAGDNKSSENDEKLSAPEEKNEYPDTETGEDEKDYEDQVENEENEEHEENEEYEE